MDKEKKKTNSIKYLIAPKISIGEIWAKKMGLSRPYTIITDERGLRGRRFKASEIIFIEEEPFDYPEHILSKIEKRKWDELVNLWENIYKHRLIMDI